MPLGQVHLPSLSREKAQAYPGRRVSHASLNRASRNLVPTFPQRSPPWLLTTAACGGLRSLRARILLAGTRTVNQPDVLPMRSQNELNDMTTPCRPGLFLSDA